MALCSAALAFRAKALNYRAGPLQRSRIDPVKCSREGNCFPDVLEAAYPGHGTLDAHAEAGVGDAAELAQVEIPLERFFGQAVLVDSLEQQLIRTHALRAADDL